MADDGRGLDRERIRARAEAMGLLEPGMASRRCHALRFHLSSRVSRRLTELTQLAGRGVGMDVVKTEVSELGGRIEIFRSPVRERLSVSTCR
jgi:chemosensory pili system protein ChpA (sensor histidine kinase/response regulator)